MIKDFHKTAIIAGERYISFTEMLQRITVFSDVQKLQVADIDSKRDVSLGYEMGPKTILFSENREGWIYAFFSIWNNRGVAVPVDSSSSAADLAYVLRDCHPACIWTSVKRIDTVRAAIEAAQQDIPVLIIDDYEQQELPAGTESADIHYDSGDTAVIIYTSGTTGSPKGVMLSFSNLLANIDSVSKEVPIFNQARRTLILLPLHHVLPLQGSVVAPLLNG